jgi:hypothetical protein
MAKEPAFYTPIQEFLEIALIDTKYFYVDLWTIIHTVSGVILGMVFARWMRPVFALAWAVGLILAYEVFELALVNVLFRPETPVDTIWDIIFGFAGAFIALRITNARLRRKAKPDESMFL